MNHHRCVLTLKVRVKLTGIKHNTVWGVRIALGWAVVLGTVLYHNWHFDYTLVGSLLSQIFVFLFVFNVSIDVGGICVQSNRNLVTPH